jgi:hypothetical protein
MGERLSVRRSIAFGRDGGEMADASHSRVVISIWAQGARFMLRHNGMPLIGGSRPALPVIALDDGDEIAWGEHRLQFRMSGDDA